jgi:hypothetical protein
MFPALLGHVITSFSGKIATLNSGPVFGEYYNVRYNMLGKEKKFKVLGLINIVAIMQKLYRACVAILDKAWR